MATDKKVEPEKKALAVQPKAIPVADHEFLAAANFAAVEDVPVWGRRLLFVILGFFVSAVVWASMTELDEVTRGNGQVIPSSKVQVIQSLDGGILASLSVREGQTVESGEELLRIDDTRFSASLDENRARETTLRASIARLVAESGKSKTLSFPAGFEKKHATLVARERELFDSRRRVLNESVGHLVQALALTREERKIIQPMVDRRIVTERDRIKLDRQIVDLERQIGSLRNEYRAEALTQLATQRAELAELEENMRTGEDRVQRSVVRSPVRGIVKNIAINTVGGVIASGDPILEVVPVDEELLVEARLEPKDVAFIQAGQRAVVKLTAYDFAQYGGMEGVVETVSADTLVDSEQQPFYRIYVRTHDNTLKHSGKEFPIIPGMVAEVDIITGKKSVAEYVLNPLRRIKHEALRER